MALKLTKSLTEAMASPEKIVPHLQGDRPFPTSTGSEQGTGMLSWLLWLGVILTAPTAMGFAVQDAHLLPSACWVPPRQCSQTAPASSSAVLRLHKPQMQTSQICLSLAGQKQDLHRMQSQRRAAALPQPQRAAGRPASELRLVQRSFQ